MKLALRLAMTVCLLAAPAGAQVKPEKSLDAADTGRSKSLDAAEDASPESPHKAPDVDAEQPDDVVGAGTEQDQDSGSLDASNAGASETSDQVEAADAKPAAAAPPPLAPAPPIEDGNFDAQAAAASARVTKAESNLAYWERAYADMLHLDRPKGAARAALIDSRTHAQADLAGAKSQVAEIASRAAAAGQPHD